MSSSFLIIGPLTKDLIIENNQERFSVGGAVYYQSFIFNSFKENYTILTNLGFDDKNLLNEFPDKSKIKAVFNSDTLFFKNNYYDGNLNHRKQESNFLNNPLLKKDLDFIDLNDFDCIVLNPLVNTDIPLDIIKYLSSFNIPIALAIQGFLRNNKNNEVVLDSYSNLEELLENIDTVFLDNIESCVLFKNEKSCKNIMKKISKFGPNEVIITCGDNGSIIYSKYEDEFYRIPSYIPRIIKNPTGAGDTYMASYLIKRFSGANIESSGKFAAMTAALKIKECSHFNKNKKFVEDELKLI
ncbi:MAG: hypothetical protein KO202_01840 [Methanobacteriaceae archaeon]|jgi:hypothetical protein|nr:hypothetical protein [Methanobacteriaceae archaeon]